MTPTGHAFSRLDMADRALKLFTSAGRWQELRLLGRHRGAHTLSPLEQALLSELVTEVKAHTQGDTLVRAHRPAPESIVLLEGTLGRVINTRDGRRQIVAVHFPGDFVDLHSLLLGHLDHDIVALKGCTVAMVPHAPLRRLLRTRIELADKLWFLTLTDAALHRQWLFRVASTSALERVANFLCEANLRLMAIGQSDGHRFALQLTQPEMGEICGVTSIHVNRMLRELRQSGICTWQGYRVEVHDIARLVSIGAFSPEYLYYDAALVERFCALADELH